MNTTIRPVGAPMIIRAALVALLVVAGDWRLAAAQEAVAPPARTDSGPDGKPPGLSPDQTAKNVESFEVVWKTVRDSYYDPKLGGLDWQAVHDELRPKVEHARSNAEARDLMAQAIETTVGPMGEMTAETYPSDYRKTDGILIPFKLAQSQGGQSFEIKLTEVKHNVELPADTFKVPAALEKK